MLTSSFGEWMLVYTGDTGPSKTLPAEILLRPGWPLEEVLPIIADIGYDTVDICTWIGHTAYPLSLGRRSRREIPRLVRDLGMTITALGAHGGSRHNFDRYGYLTRDADELEHRHKYTRACIDLAAEWEVPVVEDLVGAAPQGMNEEEAWARVVESVGRMAEYAASRGIVLGVELYAGVVNSPDAFQRLVGAVAFRALGCVMDPSNLVTSGYPDMVDNMRTVGRYIVHTHLKGVRQGGITTPGGPDDLFDIGQFARLLVEHGYDGSLTIEEYPDSYPEPISPEDSARVAFQNVSRVLDDLGLRRRK